MPKAQRRATRVTAGALKVAELFAGVGGFRLGLESEHRWNVVWSNQWEPPGNRKRQFASDCYIRHFGSAGHYNQDIAQLLDQAEDGQLRLPAVDLVVGGFPCQDYSVARPLNQADGIVGKKGVLWWQVHRLLAMYRKRRRLPRYLLLENVDRLLVSPAGQRGRDFAIILTSLSELGYDVEWRVINAADYGFPQKRRRIFIVGYRRAKNNTPAESFRKVVQDGVLARAFPCRLKAGENPMPFADLRLEDDVVQVSAMFGKGASRSTFRNAGFMSKCAVWTRSVEPVFAGKRTVLRDIIQPHEEVPEHFFVPPAQLPVWRYLKGAKNEPRQHKATGTPYIYTEGALPFPDPLDRPGRTILTAEGGSSPSRFRHIIDVGNGRYRRLTPVELEQMNGFEPGWTQGMTDPQRAFCMGNALVVGIVEKIGEELARFAERPAKGSDSKHQAR